MPTPPKVLRPAPIPASERAADEAVGAVSTDIKGRPPNESPSLIPVAPPPPATAEELLEAPAAPPAELPQVLQRTDEAAKATHPLDSAPVNSKIVIVDGVGGSGREAYLARTDADPILLPKPNPIYALPAGSKIHKRGPRQFLGLLPLDNGDVLQFQEASTFAVIAEMTHAVHDKQTRG